VMRRAGRGVLVGNLNRPLGGTRGKLEYNIRAEIMEIEWEGVKWIHDAKMCISGSCCEHGNEHSGLIKYKHFLN